MHSIDTSDRPDADARLSDDNPAPKVDTTALGAKAASPGANLDVVLDIPVTVSMEVGRRRMTIRDLLKLSHGSVLELDRDAGMPMDVLVNGTLIAEGEVVVVNDRFGIRLTDVVSMRERVKRLSTG
ncbi:flagellar motor switch protein FliN [Thioalkalicoccus limnaeus]|uniref:Flagellar motor switch protein FliN n=1 Tax=Thioalkalicoccus limnaeus TaxID=120681 RepID=A0ABV4BBP5_9GAMM